MATRVLLLSQWFDPEPTFKGLVFAKELVRRGFAVEVVTGFPNYPGGEIYPGFKMSIFKQEVIDGVLITRLPLYPSHDKSAIGRILNYTSFAVSSLLYGLFKAKRPDVIYAYHPPLTMGIAAVVLRFFRRVPVVYDVQDMWPDTLRATGMLSSEKILGFISLICNWVYRRVDKIVVLSPGFKRLLIERGVPEKKIEIIHNWCAEEFLVDSDMPVPSAFPDSSFFRVLFAGNMGKAQGLDSLLEAAELLISDKELVFVFLGGGVELERLKMEAQLKKLTNVIFLPSVPMKDVGAYLKSSDVLLVHLKKDPLFSITIPSKTQAYMAVGRPLLMAVEGDAADIVNESGCGVVAEPQNPESIAAAILKLKEKSDYELSIMSERGKTFYQSHLSLENGVDGFSCVFNEAVKIRTR